MSTNSDIGLSQRWKWDLRYFGILRCENPERAQISGCTNIL